MRKICLINQDSNSTISLNLFAKIAREGKRVLLIDLRLGKDKPKKKDIGFNIAKGLNEISDLRKYVVSLEQNLDVIYGSEFLNFQEYNLFYDLFKMDFFEKKLKMMNYDYVVLENSAELSLLATNSIFFSTEIMTTIFDEKQGCDFVNKLARFVYNFNKVYGRNLFISKIIPVFKNEVDEKSFTYLVSEFTSKLVTFPVVDKKNFEYGYALEKIAISVIDNEKFFDPRYKNGEKQKLIKEYLEILSENSSNEIPLTKF